MLRKEAVTDESYVGKELRRFNRLLDLYADVLKSTRTLNDFNFQLVENTAVEDKNMVNGAMFQTRT